MNSALKVERPTAAAPGPTPLTRVKATPTQRTLFGRHLVLAYYVLTFLISWGGLVLVTRGTGIVATTEQCTCPRCWSGGWRRALLDWSTQVSSFHTGKLPCPGR